MGFKPLCEFLGCDVNLDAGAQVPMVNENATHQKLKRFLFIRGLKAWAAALGASAVVIFAAYRLGK